MSKPWWSAGFWDGSFGDQSEYYKEFKEWEPDVTKHIEEPDEASSENYSALTEEELAEAISDAVDSFDFNELKKLLTGRTLEGLTCEENLSVMAAKDFTASFPQKMEMVKYLLLKGDKPDTEKDFGRRADEYQIFIKCIDAWLADPQPDKIDGLFDRILASEWDKVTQPALEAIREAAKKARGKHKGLLINFTHGWVYIDSLNPNNKSILEKGTNRVLYALHDNDAIEALPDRLRPGLQEMADEGIFDKLMSSGEFPIVIWNRYSNHLAKQKTIITVHNQQALEKARADWADRFKAFETAENKVPLLASITDTLFFGHGIIEPQPQKAVDILFEELYKANKYEDRVQIEEMLRYYEDFHGFSPEIMYRLGLYYKNRDEKENAALFFRNAVHEKHPLAEAELADLGLKEKTEPIPIDAYTEGDLFKQTANFRARAYRSGYVKLEFFNEGETAYSEALDYLNTLMDKGYSKLSGGYELRVKFAEEPVFLDVPDFPKVPVHAFFAKAVRYPALHGKIRDYAQNTLLMYDTYKDLDGAEQNTNVGTFAACALAMADISNLDLLSLYGQESDGGHQNLQLHMIPVVIERYGVTPVTAPVIYDLVISYGQIYEIDLPQTLYTDISNLKAVIDYANKPSDIAYYIDHWFEGLNEEDEVLARLKELKKGAQGELAEVYKNLAKLYKKVRKI